MYNSFPPLPFLLPFHPLPPSTPTTELHPQFQMLHLETFKQREERVGEEWKKYTVNMERYFLHRLGVSRYETNH